MAALAAFGADPGGVEVTAADGVELDAIMPVLVADEVDDLVVGPVVTARRSTISLGIRPRSWSSSSSSGPPVRPRRARACRRKVDGSWRQGWLKPLACARPVAQAL